MPVKLDYALCSNALIHISNRIYKSKSYKCPACKEEVIAKKGAERSHHFAHQYGSPCSASEETILHYYSKYYIISESNNIELLFSTENFTKIQLKSAFFRFEGLRWLLIEN